MKLNCSWKEMTRTRRDTFEWRCSANELRRTTNQASVEIRAAQIKPALWTLQLTMAFAQFRRTVRTILARVDHFSCRSRTAILSAPFLLLLLHHAARSLAACEVQFQQSAINNHAPKRRHTLTYLPRSGIMVPSAFRMTSEKRPSSMAVSPE